MFLSPFFFFFLIYFWLCWVLVATHGLSSSCGQRGPLLVAVHGSLTTVASPAAEARGPQQPWHASSAAAARGLQSTGSAALVHGPSRSAACGIFPDQGPNPSRLALAGELPTTAPPGKPP